MSRTDRDGAYRFLLDLPRYAVVGSAAYRPGLDRIRELLWLTGDPHLRFPSIHIAGTNGKGSVASITAAILTSAGLRVGLHMSPHIRGVEERMRIDGGPPPREWLAETVSVVRDHIESVGASFFEATVLLSFMRFAEEGVDVAIVEVGLGGRFDATNIITPEIAAITDISLDHTDILGPTIEHIAREKAGIIKSEIPVLTIAQGAALAEIEERARSLGSALEDVRRSCRVSDAVAQLSGTALGIKTPQRDYGSVHLQVAGRHQIWNAVLAVRLAEEYARRKGSRLPAEAVREGLSSVRELTGLSGRLQVISRQPLVVVDNAHNPQSMESVLSHVKGFVAGRLHVGIGLMRDKNADRIADLLAASADRVCVIPIAGERALDSSTLASLLKSRNVAVDISSGVPDALSRFEAIAGANDALLLTGSHVVVAEALRSRDTD